MSLRKIIWFLFPSEGILTSRKDYGSTTIVSGHVSLEDRSNFMADSSLNSYMGIIPELERVFITIDHSLFLWDYVEG